jgi:hypothetical protein
MIRRRSGPPACLIARVSHVRSFLPRHGCRASVLGDGANPVGPAKTTSAVTLQDTLDAQLMGVFLVHRGVHRAYLSSCCLSLCST